MIEKMLLTVKEAAELLSLSRATVYPLVMSGEIASVKVGRSRRVSRNALLEFIRGLDAGARAS